MRHRGEQSRSLQIGSENGEQFQLFDGGGENSEISQSTANRGLASLSWMEFFFVPSLSLHLCPMKERCIVTTTHTTIFILFFFFHSSFVSIRLFKNSSRKKMIRQISLIERTIKREMTRGGETQRRTDHDAGGDIGSKTEATKLDELALPRGIQLDVEY